jgi:microcompartment protein CcmK/EutM
MHIRDHAEDLIADARDIPRSFGYSGGLDAFHAKATWGPAKVARTRDAHVLEISNYEVSIEMFEEKFDSEGVESGWVIERHRHWGVGWIKTVMIKLVDEEGEPSPQAILAAEIVCALSEYPVLNDEDYSRRQYEEEEDSE